MARPKLEIDPIEVEKLAKIGATNTEIADFFGCNETTIRTRFSENLIKGRASMKLRLRQLQWRAADNGNITMLIWLGKQELGQTEKVEEKKVEENKEMEVSSMTKQQAKELLLKILEGEIKPKEKANEGSSS